MYPSCVGTKTVVRHVRLVSGLILMAYVIGHLANLSIGLHSLAAMESWRPRLPAPWPAPLWEWVDCDRKSSNRTVLGQVLQ